MNDAIQQVIERLAIEDVAHTKGTYQITEKYLASPPGEISVRLQLRTHFDRCVVDELSAGDDDLIHRYRFCYELGLRLLRDTNAEEIGDDDAVIAVVEAQMYALYGEVVKQDREPLEAEVLDEFGRENALYHVWPYWREYVQSVFSRLRLPPITVPMFRLPEKNWRHSSSEATDA